jgi:Tol biopolymer transport system component
MILVPCVRGRAAACLLSSTTLLCAALTSQSTLRVVGAQGQIAEGAYGPVLSGDGRFVAFTSFGPALPGDTNGVADVYVLERATGALVRASETATGAQGNGHSWEPRLSADGRYLAFSSRASNLAATDGNGAQDDVFVKDLVTGALQHVSRGPSGAGGNGASLSPEIAADGSCVVFFSTATNLGVPDTNGLTDSFLFDRTTGQLECLSVDGAGQAVGGRLASVSGDGRFVVFETTEQTLATPVVPGGIVVALRDRQTGAVTALNVQAGGVRHAEAPLISADGGTVVFRTAFPLDPLDTDTHDDPYAIDLPGGLPRVLTLPTTSPLVGVFHHGVSADGRCVVVSTTEALVTTDTNVERDVYVVDRVRGRTELVSVTAQGGLGNSASFGGSISDDGRFAAWSSRASNLVGNDTNLAEDAFVRDRAPAASAQLYGAGLAGTGGAVPAFGLLGLPVLGTTPALALGNPSGVPTLGVLVLGTAATALPTPVLGTLLAAPDATLPLAIGGTGLVAPIAIPGTIDLAGAELFLQALLLDAGAPAGVAFTRGLAVRIGG